MPKRKFSKPSFETLYTEDPEFSKIVKILCDAFSIKKPNLGLYAELDRAGIDLLFKHSTKPLAEHSDSESESDIEDNSGSSSEFSEEMENQFKPKTPYHLSHSKIRVCSGMKAILIAQYAAMSYLNKEQGAKTFSLDVEHMYFEVEEALKLVKAEGITLNNVRENSNSKILHYDLNHCNSTNAGDNKNLKAKLTEFEPNIAILDYTSTTMHSIEEAMDLCFANENIKFVIYVTSGLKNEQGGLDINPYGEVRVCARDRATANKLIKFMDKGLSKEDEDKLSEKTHEMVRVCKKRGLASSFRNSFHKNIPRCQPIEEEKSYLSTTPKLK